MRSISDRRGVAVFAFLVVCFIPLAAFADAAEIRVPPGAPAVSRPPSDGAEIHVPIGLWDVVLLVLLEAKIGPPGG